MNKKVFISMLSLCVAFLVGCYIIKIFFPQEFALGIDNARIVAIGSYIDTHKWASIIFGVVIGFIFDWFYFGAVTKRLVPHCANIIIIVVYNVAIALYYNFAPVDVIINHSTTIMVLSNCYMVFTPMFFTKTIRELSITYAINIVSQLLLIYIRSVPIEMATLSSLATFIMSIDNYLWIALCYIIFNYNKFEKEN